jgi:release factor glutamine methyltransferase
MVRRGQGPWPASNVNHDVQSWLMQRMEMFGEERELRSIIRLMLDKSSGMSRSERLMLPWLASESQLDQLAVWADRFMEGEPIQYILSSASFMGLELQADARGLIPRPETEELVRLLLKETQEKGPCNVLDLGTGSGCMALAWQHARPEDGVMACDVSDAALALAQENATYLGLVQIDWVLHDLINGSPMPDWSFDVLMSNPPYIPQLEKEEMEIRVTRHEPELALFVPDEEPLLFYKTIGARAVSEGWLRSGGLLGFECHRDFSHAVAAWLEDSGEWENIRVEQDMQNAHRMVLATRR